MGRASGLWCFRRSKAKAAKVAEWKRAKDAGENPPEYEEVEDTRLTGMRARLGGCLILPVYDLEGKVVSWVGRLVDTARTLAELAGDYEPEEADVSSASDGKYIYLPRTRSSVTKYPLLGSVEVAAIEEFFPLLLSPRLIEERRNGYKNAATVPVWICEGVFDGVLAFLGSSASIATHGAYCYLAQVKLLVETLRDFARHHYKIYLCFDRDPARFDPYKKLALGPGQRGSCMLLAAIIRLDPQLARAIQVIELPSRPDGSKLDLGDLLAGAAASVKAPAPTGDPDLVELEAEERGAYVSAVKATRVKLLDKLALGAVKSHKYLVAQIPSMVEPENRTAALREVGLLDLATADPECWDVIADEVAQKLGITKAHDVRAWKSTIGKKAKEKAKEVAREQIAEGDVERFRRDDGTLKPTFDAARVLLEQDYAGRLAWNEMALDVTIDKKSLDELGEGNILSGLSRRHGWDGSVDVARYAIGIAARTLKTYHPVREYLEDIRGKWHPDHDEDTIPAILRAMGKPAEILDTSPIELSDRYPEEWMDAVKIRKFLRSMVARIFSPGCKVDMMLVLLGSQGGRKSSMLEALMEDPDWFNDSHIDITTKDGQMLMRPFWLHELQEVDKASWYDSISEWKQFITTKVDKLRPPVGAGQDPSRSADA